MKVQFPEALDFLFSPARYKILYGGRGGTKSWGMARALLIQARQRPLRILCAREIQQSLKDSVHQLISEQVRAMGLDNFYAVQESAIFGVNGSEFFYAGLHHNIQSIKSIEGCDIVWVEEAQTVSDESWEILIPTIRKPGSEIWVSFNPRYETDPTWQRFGKFPPASAVVREVTWRDNPWLSDEMRLEKDELRQRDYDSYLHVWEGKFRTASKRALFRRDWINDNRITLQEVQWDKLIRIVVAIDPAVSNNPDSDETGICVAGLVRSGHIIVLDDLSCKESPLGWAEIALGAYFRRRADRIIGERNNGGDLVERNIRAVPGAENVPFRLVTASRGKAKRAEPVASMYERGLVHHVGHFPALETQMCVWDPTDENADSPDRMDAMVYAITELAGLDAEAERYVVVNPPRLISSI